MAESEFETSLDSLMVPQQQMSQQQMSQQQLSQEQLEYQQQIPQQQMSQEQLEYQQQQMVQQQVPRAPSGKLMEKLAGVDYQDSLQSIIIIAALFILFSNCYFKNFCKTLPFLCITDGEFNMQSLVILGVAVGICYIFIKMYLI